jgi:hypothetical protein
MNGSTDTVGLGSPAFGSVPVAGESPLFPPQCADAEEAKETLLHVVGQPPEAFGLDRSRFRLSDILDVCPWLRLSDPSGVHHLFDRLGIAYKRGRITYASPDPDYLSKLRYLHGLVEEAQASDGRMVVGFLDEFTYYRQPTVDRAYNARNSAQPPVRWSHDGNGQTRVIGFVDALSGKVVYWQGWKVFTSRLVEFYRKLTSAYPQAERIWVAQDNWPVHFHPAVLVALEPQERPFPFRPCPHWSTEPEEKTKRRWGHLSLPVQVMPLPTYAPWTNPIEKVWRWGYADLLHHHGLADSIDRLRVRFGGFLDRFAEGSTALLRYIGLSDPSKLYANVLTLLGSNPLERARAPG